MSWLTMDPKSKPIETFQAKTDHMKIDKQNELHKLDCELVYDGDQSCKQCTC